MVLSDRNFEILLISYSEKRKFANLFLQLKQTAESLISTEFPFYSGRFEIDKKLKQET